MKLREKLYSASEVIVVALKIFTFSSDGACQKKVMQVSDVQDSTITVNSCTYSTIHHHGSSAHSGHYTSLHRIGGQWILANDLNVVPVNWPEGASGLYMLFYHCHNG